MTTELIVAPPGTGKTTACFQRIQATQKEIPLSQVWVLVPDRLQAGAFRHHLANAGGAIHVQVGRFPDLYKHILEHEGTFHPTASAPLLHRLIQQSVDKAVKQGEIPYYQPLQLFPGFITALRDAFAELKRALVTPQEFTDFTNSGSSAQKDLSTLYTHYQASLRELRWTDSEEVTWQAIEALKQRPISVSSIRLLIVDGFDSFDGAQYRVLKLLSEQVGELLITFPGLVKSTRPAHRRFTDSIERLISDLSPKITTLDNPPHLPDAVIHIEKHLFEVEVAPKLSTNQPLLLEARSPADEARETLRWIKKLVVRENVPLSDCVIFTPNHEMYHPALRAAAAEFGIPIRFTLDDALESSPAITALINLLSLPQRNFNSRYLINSLRSPYFDFSLDPETVDILEMVCRVGQIVEGREQWEEVWQRLFSSSEEQKQDLDDERNSPSLPRGAEAEGLSRLLRSVFDMITPPAQSDTLTGWITWLEDLLEHLYFYENAQSERDQVACNTFREVLGALVLSEAVAGQRKLEYIQFYADLQGALAGEGYREASISGQETLLVGRMTEARGLRFKAVALLGLSEGSFPANERPDPFLDEELRKPLGLELRLQREQAGLFYQAVTRADQYLLLTRPYLSEDGEEWEESAYWKAVSSLLEKSAVTRVSPDTPRPLCEAASTQELLFSAVQRQVLPSDYSFLSKRWQDLQHAQLVLQARRLKLARGPFEGSAEAAASDLQARYSPEKVWSASRLESYANCPFQFFVNNALGVEARSLPQLGMDVAQIGSILHKILELTYAQARDPMAMDSLLESLAKISREVFASAPKVFGFRPSNLWEIEKTQLLGKLQNTITALAGDADWLPFAYEAKFGLSGAAPLLINLGAEELKIHGVVDRIDKNAAGQIRVIDYKTGGDHLAKKDLERGYRLQLPIYAMAARDALHLGNPVDGFYWKILDAEAGSLKLANFATDEATGVEAAIQATREHLVRIVNGIRCAEFPPKRPEGGCPPYCPASQWCWRYEPGW
ncbi:MAG: PD-(D/E)XK nuclease family protein [Anaerolineaceae bacterium]